LQRLVSQSGRERLTAREIRDSLGERASALLIVLLALPNIVPMLPPIPLICGLLIGLAAVRMAAGRPTPWLPNALMKRDIARADAQRIVDTAMPWILRVETLCRPRFAAYVSEAWASRLLGVLLVIFAAGLLVAAPIIGQIPLGIAICLVGFGIVERDGLVVAIGAVIGIAGVSLSLGFAWALLKGAGLLLRGFGLLG
jgi:hypothetical protein